MFSGCASATTPFGVPFSLSLSLSPFGNGRKRFVRGDLQRNKTRRNELVTKSTQIMMLNTFVHNFPDLKSFEELDMLPRYTRVFDSLSHPVASFTVPIWSPMPVPLFLLMSSSPPPRRRRSLSAAHCSSIEATTEKATGGGCISPFT